MSIFCGFRFVCACVHLSISWQQGSTSPMSKLKSSAVVRWRWTCPISATRVVWSSHRAPSTASIVIDVCSCMTTTVPTSINVSASITGEFCSHIRSTHSKKWFFSSSSFFFFFLYRGKLYWLVFFVVVFFSFWLNRQPMRKNHSVGGGNSSIDTRICWDIDKSGDQMIFGAQNAFFFFFHNTFFCVLSFSVIVIAQMCWLKENSSILKEEKQSARNFVFYSVDLPPPPSLSPPPPSLSLSLPLRSLLTFPLSFSGSRSSSSPGPSTPSVWWPCTFWSKCG